MYKKLSSIQKAYIAGFLDGDGSIYVRMKPSPTYRYGFQVAPSVVLFQSKKERKNFEMLCSLIGLGYMRERKDGVLEYTINRKDAILSFLSIVKPHVILKKRQVALMKKILVKKEHIKTQKDFYMLAKLVDEFRTLNYSKRRKVHKLTP